MAYVLANSCAKLAPLQSYGHLKQENHFITLYILLFLFAVNSFFVLFSSLHLTRLENKLDVVASVLQLLIHGFSKLTFLRSGTGLDHDMEYDSAFSIAL